MVKSKDEVELLKPIRGNVLPDWPYANYPDFWPAVAVSVEKIPYELHKTLVFASSITKDMVFRSRLAPSDRKESKQRGYPFTQIGGVHCLPWSHPSIYCPNKLCSLAKVDRT